jgi:hypothetical protein
MEAIMAICLPYLIQKPIFTMPVKQVETPIIREAPAPAQVLKPYVVPPPVKLIGPDPVTGQMPTPYYLPQEVPQTEYAPRPDRPGYDL